MHVLVRPMLPQCQGQALAGRIVDYLAANCGLPSLYCIPFAHLEALYQRYGFKRLDDAGGAPELVAHKLRWCRQHYPTPVILMHRHAAGQAPLRQ